MKFTTLSNLLLSIIGALLLLHSFPASASPNCTSSCGNNTDTGYLEQARAQLLKDLGCWQRGLAITYKGGRTFSQVVGTPYQVVFSTPAGMQMYLECSAVEDILERIITSCSSQGGGHDTDGNHCAAVTACSSTTSNSTDNGVGEGGKEGGDWFTPC